MAITVVGSATGSSLGSVTVAVPAHIGGDVAVAFASSNFPVPSSSVSAGWEPIPSSRDWIRAYLRVLPDSSQVSFTWSNGIGSFEAARASVLVLRGADTAALLGAMSETPSSTDAYVTTTAGPGLTMTRRGSLALWWEYPAEGGPWHGPVGFSEVSSPDRGRLGVAYATFSNPGPTGRLSVVTRIQPARSITAVEVRALDLAPNAPTLTTLASGLTVARGDVNRNAHIHSDPDGDGQAAFRHRYRFVGAAGWLESPVQNTVNQFFDAPANTYAVGDYERQVQTASLDPYGVLKWSPWSASGFFSVAERPDGPTFVSPINGETIGASSVNVELSAAEFDTLELRVLDAAGAEIVPVMSSTTGLFTVTGLANSQTVTMQARTVVDTLAGAWTSITVPISYTTPPTPLVSLSPYEVAGAPVGITVFTAVPAPTGGQPAAESIAVERSQQDVAGVWSPFRALQVDLSPTAVYDDLTVASGVPYRYQVRASASNGTDSVSAVVDEFGAVVTPTDPGGGGGGTPDPNDPVSATVEATV